MEWLKENDLTDPRTTFSAHFPPATTAAPLHSLTQMKTYFVCMSSGGSKRGKETEGKRDAETETERRVKCGRAAPLLSDFLFLSGRRFSNNCGMFHFVLGEGSRHVVTKWDTVKDSNIQGREKGW